MHVCAQFNKCSLPSVPFLGSTWLRRRGTVTLLPSTVLSLLSHPCHSLPPHRAFLSFACRAEEDQSSERANERARCSSRFRLRAVQIYDSRDFYLILIPILFLHTSAFVSSRENFPWCPTVVRVRIRAIKSRLLRAIVVCR